MKWIGLNEKNYWKRIAAIRKWDMELTKAEQTPEAHGYKRTEAKFHTLEIMTIKIAESETEQAGLLTMCNNNMLIRKHDCARNIARTHDDFCTVSKTLTKLLNLP